ncbi:MAG: enoyl-CoA hydratase/isomerase family protein [Deltaproteobacteria bacterium]|nr:enoyl-CoA hydratase/isomerase family protein [Deltaproteobacteria bacterium]
MSDYTSLRVSYDDGYATVTLERPERMNALSRVLLLELQRVFTALAEDPGVRVVLLTGSGDKAFCAGADLKERQGMSEDDIRALLGTYRESFGAVDRCPRPVVAALNGVAFGGGFELALACDLRVAVPEAVVGLPETSLAIIPGAGGTQRLARLLGPGRAKELILLATRLPAPEALRLGLLTAVAEPGESALQAARRLTAPLVKGAPIALAAAMDAVDVGADLTLEEGLLWEAKCYERTLGSRDRREALEAFAQKRKPVYRGE